MNILCNLDPSGFGLADGVISRRRLLTGAMTAAATSLLAACEPDPQIEQSIDAALVEKAPSVEAVGGNGDNRQTPRPTEAVRDAGATITIHPREVIFRFNGLSPASQDAAFIEIARFKDLTGIAVIHDFVDWAGSFQKLVDELAVLSAPDAWYAGGLWIPGLVATDQVLELDEYVDEWADFYPQAQADVTYNGHIYGIPFRTTYRGSPVIRASLFEKAGLEPTPPTTWDELNEITPRLAIRDGEVFEQAGINLEHHTQVYEDWLRQDGETVFDEDTFLPDNFPRGLAALGQHVRPGLVDLTMPREGVALGAEGLQAICDGRAAYQQLWPADLANCEVNAPDAFADLATGKPLGGRGDRAMQLYVDKFMVWKLTRIPDDAFEAIKYFVTPTVNHAINVINEHAMPCRGAMESYELYEREPWKTLAANGRKFGKLRQIVPEHFDVEAAMSRWVKKAALGEVEVDRALEGMDDEIVEIRFGDR